MKRQDLFKMFGISFIKYATEDKLHILKGPIVSLSNWGWGSYSGIYSGAYPMRAMKPMMTLMRHSQIRWASGKAISNGMNEIERENDGNIIGRIKGKELVNQKMIEKNINSNPFKEIVAKNKGGYIAYLKNKALLGNIADILND